MHTYYGGIHALKGISVTVEEGEVVTLIGSNGAGKSTTLKTICGQTRAREGKVIFNGKDITGMRTHEIALLGVAHVPEGRRIFPKLTVRENLE
ncbi:ATP-binding cassette domain-containing protein, partial [Microbacteriaceae bacterium K1510]|nr:ATP-binding cassette domain-containing protein [Microbacteriaceae bacterium K1510]